MVHFIHQTFRYITFRFLVLNIVFFICHNIYASNEINILVVHSDPQGFPATSLINKGIVKYFKDTELDINLAYENYGSSMVKSNSSYGTHFAEMCRIKYKEHPIDAIICVERDVINWFIDYAPSELKKKPTFYLGGIFDVEKVPCNFYPIEIVHDVKNSIKTIMQVLPKTKNIYFVIDEYTHKRLQKELNFKDQSVEIIYLENRSIPEIIKILNSAPPQSAMYYHSVYNSKNSQEIPQEVLEEICIETKIPTFTVASHFIKGNIIGGYAFDFELLGYSVAEYIDSAIYNGLEPLNFKINASSYIFNKKALDHYGISLKQLPKNSTIINKEISIWDYWLPISVFFGLLFVLIIATVVLLFQRSKLITTKKHIQLINSTLEKRVNDQVEKIKHQNTILIAKNSKITKLQKHKELVTNMIIHDLKNPLSIILAYNKIPDQITKEELLNTAAKSMQLLISNILDIYKIENQDIIIEEEDLQLSDILNKALTEISNTARFHLISLKVSIEKDCMLKGDLQLLIRVVINILSNAIKNSPPKSQIEIFSLIEDENIILFFKDSGHGVGEAFSKEFLKDNTNKKDSNPLSSGIGLSFCKLALNAHNGSIGVNNNQDIGATFWVKLPVVKMLNSRYQDKIHSDKNVSVKILAPSAQAIALGNKLRILNVYQLSEIEAVLADCLVTDDPYCTSAVRRINAAVMLCDEDSYKNIIDELEEQS